MVGGVFGARLGARLLQFRHKKLPSSRDRHVPDMRTGAHSKELVLASQFHARGDRNCCHHCGQFLPSILKRIE